MPGMNKDVSLDNTAKAFASKNNKELRNSFWLFRLMANPFLVKVLSKLTVVAIRLGLPVKFIIKPTIFNQFCGGESLSESKAVVAKLHNSNIGSILDYSAEGKEREDDFEQTTNEILKIIALAANNPAIPYTSLKLTGIVRFGLLERVSSGAALNADERPEWDQALRRLERICEDACLNNVPVYFDAEESWIQNAIDSLAEQMSMRYNKQKAIILTTLQMYRWDRLNYLTGLINKARSKGFFIGIKLVRGAYMEKERLRAQEMGYRSPIQPDKESTDRDFDRALDICLANIDLITLCAGTHNEASTMYLVDKLKQLHIPPGHPHVYFSQLYGMSDHISFNLADAGYNVTKYLPYGPVDTVIPYLIRRAEENTSIAGQAGRELRLLIEEKNRRLHNKLLTSGRVV